MIDDERIQALIAAAHAMFQDALRRYSDAAPPGAKALADAYEAGEIELGVTVTMLPQASVACWARHVHAGPRQVLISYPLNEAPPVGSLFN